jgi:excisionase family DNA binding protein
MLQSPVAGHLLDNAQAATYLGITPRTLEVWRAVKRHPIPYIKVGRLVKYRRDDLDAWLASRTIDDRQKGDA